MDDERIYCKMCGHECDVVASTVYCDNCGYMYELDGEDMEALLEAYEESGDDYYE